MKRSLSYILSVGGLLATAASVAGIWAVTKANSMVAQPDDRNIQAPPTITAQPINADLATTLTAADPLSQPAWRNVRWTKLAGPLHASREAAPTWAAIAYDSARVHVAVLGATTNVVQGRDTFTIWLDTSAAQNGTEQLELKLTDDGAVTTTWHRSANPAMPKDNGTPNFLHPMSSLPGITINGLTTKITRGQFNGEAAWGAVVSIPLDQTPAPLRMSPLAPGGSFKLNVIRTHQAPGNVTAQANLSPVWVGAQVVSPQRMSVLVLGDSSSFASRHGTTE